MVPPQRSVVSTTARSGCSVQHLELGVLRDGAACGIYRGRDSHMELCGRSMLQWELFDVVSDTVIRIRRHGLDSMTPSSSSCQVKVQNECRSTNKG